MSLSCKSSITINRCSLLPTASSRKAVCIKASSADNQLLKKPELKKSEQPEGARKLFSDAPGPAPAADAPVASTSSKTVTIEYQRMRAKEIRQYFIDQKEQDVRAKAQVFGWTAKNEISNGRWVMFGLLVGMLTEYATGVDFIEQIKLLLTYLGIADLD